MTKKEACGMANTFLALLARHQSPKVHLIGLRELNKICGKMLFYRDRERLRENIKILASRVRNDEALKRRSPRRRRHQPIFDDDEY